jgi:molybdenum cofactor biosynthesis protein B
VADDESGKLCRALTEGAGHEVAGYQIVPDDADAVRGQCFALAESRDVDVILLNGGTGVSPRDHTYEAIASLLTKRLDGFGEIFRMLSFQEIGSRALASRAVAGLCGRTLIFAMPGSAKAVRLAMEKLIGPEIGHLVGEMKKWQG